MEKKAYLGGVFPLYTLLEFLVEDSLEDGGGYCDPAHLT